MRVHLYAWESFSLSTVSGEIQGRARNTEWWGEVGVVSFMYPCVSMCGACAKCKCACECLWGHDLWLFLTPDIAATDTSLPVGRYMYVSSGDTRVQGSAAVDPQMVWSQMAPGGGGVVGGAQVRWCHVLRLPSPSSSAQRHANMCGRDAQQSCSHGFHATLARESWSGTGSRVAACACTALSMACRTSW